MDDYNEQFMWKRQPDAENLAVKILDRCLDAHSGLQRLNHDLHVMTSTRLFDWVDHLATSSSRELHDSLKRSGYEEEGRFDGSVSYRHFGAQLPTIVMTDDPDNVMGCAVKVESIADFLMAHGLDRRIEGSFFSPYRRSLVSEENDISFWVVERRGTRTMEPSSPSWEYVTDYLEAMELWQTRPRESLDEKAELQTAIELAKDMVLQVGRDVAAWIVCEGERKYWQFKNMAGQIQKGRQDRLGMGWANHDHHTFRSSRTNFAKLVELFEVLGFTCRERFYAGEEAGWGAQVMENANATLVLFLDVDLSPDEVAIDFAHEPLSEPQSLGTVGLWCALHGDSILKAGMHHLEAQFNFEDLKHDLSRLGIGLMDPFSDFSYLRQAFTNADIWRVDPKRVDALVHKNLITSEQATQFLEEGAVGSVMENLQRREGYKGFNQKNVSNILRRTDPRRGVAGDV